MPICLPVQLYTNTRGSWKIIAISFPRPGPSPCRRTQFAPAKADAARDAARFGGQQLHDRQRRHALARARSADDGDHLAGMHVEGHAANHRPPLALRQEGGCEVVDGEDLRVARGRVVASLRGRQCRPLGPPAGTCADVGMQASSMSPPLRLPGPSSPTRYEARRLFRAPCGSGPGGEDQTLRRSSTARRGDVYHQKEFAVAVTNSQSSACTLFKIDERFPRAGDGRPTEAELSHRAGMAVPSKALHRKCPSAALVHRP